jgi:hypothetical protein
MEMLGESLFISKVIRAWAGATIFARLGSKKQFLRRNDPAEELKQQSEDGWLSRAFLSVLRSPTPTIGRENHQGGAGDEGDAFHLGNG